MVKLSICYSACIFFAVDLAFCQFTNSYFELTPISIAFTLHHSSFDRGKFDYLIHIEKN